MLITNLDVESADLARDLIYEWDQTGGPTELFSAHFDKSPSPEAGRDGLSEYYVFRDTAGALLLLCDTPRHAGVSSIQPEELPQLLSEIVEVADKHPNRGVEFRPILNHVRHAIEKNDLSLLT